jgi:hypothetical protein
VLKQLLVITRAAHQTRDIPFRHRLIMKSKGVAAQCAIQGRVILLTAHLHRHSVFSCPE